MSVIYFDERSRVWKKSDLLTLLVEMYRLNPLIVVDKMKLSPHLVGERLKRFYSLVDIHANDDHVKLEGLLIDLKDISDYSKAASQATNDRGSRIRRGEIIHRVILDSEE